MPVERLDMSEHNDIQRRKAFALGVESVQIVGTVVRQGKGVPELYHLFVGHVGDILHTLFLAEQIAEQPEMAKVEHRQTVRGTAEIYPIGFVGIERENEITECKIAICNYLSKQLYVMQSA